MERFAQLIVAGGLALVAGLWLEQVFEVSTPGWGVGVLLVLLGAGGLAAGIWVEVDVRP